MTKARGDSSRLDLVRRLLFDRRPIAANRAAPEGSALNCGAT